MATLRPSERRALRKLADAGHRGCTESILLAHGFTVDLLTGLVRQGFATAGSETVRAGWRWIAVTRFRVTDAGKVALKG
jgi:hypothetical protein